MASTSKALERGPQVKPAENGQEEAGYHGAKPQPVAFVDGNTLRLRYSGQNSGVAWCWEDKAAKRLIRRRCGDDNTAASRLAVYGALAEIASDTESTIFKTTHDWIEYLSQFKKTAVKESLDDLVAFGLLYRVTPKLKGPCTYYLLACHEKIEEDSISMNRAGRSAANDGRSAANDGRSADLEGPTTSEQPEHAPDKLNETTSRSALKGGILKGGKPLPPKEQQLVLILEDLQTVFPAVLSDHKIIGFIRSDPQLGERIVAEMRSLVKEKGLENAFTKGPAQCFWDCKRRFVSHKTKRPGAPPTFA